MHPNRFSNPVRYIKLFAWFSIVALSFILISNFWLPLLIGAVSATLLVLLLPSRR